MEMMHGRPMERLTAIRGLGGSRHRDGAKRTSSGGNATNQRITRGEKTFRFYVR